MPGHPIATRAYTNLLASGIAGARDWQSALARLARGSAWRQPPRADARTDPSAWSSIPEGNPRHNPAGAEDRANRLIILLVPESLFRMPNATI